MAQYAVLMYAPATDGEAAAVPGEREVHDLHAEDLRSSGTMVTAFALQPVETATSIRGDMLTDGPFIEAKEVVAGFYVIEAHDLDAALEIAQRNPILRQGGGVEVRPVESCWVGPQTVEYGRATVRPVGG
jgi:hypothetical protein